MCVRAYTLVIKIAKLYNKEVIKNGYIFRKGFLREREIYLIPVRLNKISFGERSFYFWDVEIIETLRKDGKYETQGLYLHLIILEII